jgi:dipeptidyl-peptidase-4
MTTRLAALVLCAVVLSMPSSGVAQGTKADYQRADSLRERTRDKVFRATVRPNWFAGGSRFWYRNDLAGGAREFIAVDAARGERRPAFDHTKLAEALSKATSTSHPHDHLPIDRIAIEDDGAILFKALDKGWRFTADSAKLEEAKVPDAAPATQPDRPDRGPGGGRRQGSRRSDDSPDGKWSTFVRDHKLFLREKANGAETALATEGIEADGYESGVFWSPDAKSLVALRTAKGDTRKVYLIESSPKEGLQPRLQSYDYLKPGDKVPISRPHLFDVAARKEIAVGEELAPNPYSIGDVRWSPDSSRFTYLYNARGHQSLKIIAVDASTGASRAIIDEKSPTFVDYSQKFFVQHLDATDELLWMSERDGWNHLYLIDAKTGSVKNPITKGEWVVRGVDRVDAEARQVWFHAGGIRPGQDPYYVHFARVNFDGTGLVVLTEGDGTHAVEYSPDRKYLIDTYSRVDMPPVVELRTVADGKLVCVLERADASALASTGWQAPERFVAKGRDGKTDIHGVIYRPTNFDPAKKYPLIESIYAGPQGAFVPKNFTALPRTQSLAELGFILVQIDGMGTNWRSKSFHDVCWKNLGDAGFPDRILWMKAAARKYPSMDLTRVGLYGGSAGGQNAMGGLLFHGDFYKVGVADCGCHDNRMDKIWWNEAWMGWPIGPQYAASSNVTNAHRLRGKLLLTVGEFDRNVDPASTMQVVDALIKAGKDFELIVFPGGGHGSGGNPYGDRRRRDFFVKHLLNVEPPDRNATGPDATDSRADATDPSPAERPGE